MALVADIAGLTAPDMMDAHSMFNSLDSATGEAVAEGARDFQVWDRSDAYARCASMSLGSQFRGAVWDSKEKRAVTVALGSGKDDPQDSFESFLRARVIFEAGAGPQELQRWLRPDSEARAHGNMPIGVRMSDEQTAGTAVRDVHRLLGLVAEDGERILGEESRRCGAKLVAMLKCDNEPNAIIGVQAVVQVEGSTATLDIECEDLPAFVFASCRRRFADSARGGYGGPLPSDLALAVPTWWRDVHRSAAAVSCSRADVQLRRIVSAPLCATVGMFARLCPEDVAEAASISDGRCLLLVMDLDEDGSADVAVIEATPHPDLDVMPQLHGFTAPVTSALWMAALASAEFTVRGTAGGPCRREKADSSLELAVAVRNALDTAKLSSEDVSLMILAGDAAQDCLGANFAALPLLRVDPGDAARGLARIIAAESGEPGVFCEVTEVLSADLGVRTVKASGVSSEVDELFAQGMRLPSVVSREYVREDGDVGLVAMQRDLAGEWKPCQWQPGVLTYFGDDGEPIPAKSANVRFEADSSGALLVQVDDCTSMPKDMTRTIKIIFWVAILLLLMGGSLSTFMLSSAVDPVSRARSDSEL